MLFSAAATAGALTAGGTADDIAALTAYAKNLGLAFQIVDDLLDVTGTSAETGKVTRARRAQDDVRVVQRRGRRARARGRAVRDGDDGARRRSAAAPRA